MTDAAKKIVIAGTTGNAGKTTLREHMFAPRLPGVPLVAIESINTDVSHANVVAVRGENFSDVQDFVLTTDSVVIDVGSSNFEAFYDRMKQYSGSHEDFDLFVVPVLAGDETFKQEQDVVRTIQNLADIGVPRQKIVTIFNMVERPDDVPKKFRMLRAFHAEQKLFVLREDAVVTKNPIYSALLKMSNPPSIIELRDDPVDYKAALAAAIREGASEEERNRLKSMIANKRLATGVAAELDTAFKAVMRKVKNGE